MIKSIQILFLCALANLCMISTSTADDHLPSDSVYQLQSDWRDQDGNTLKLADLAGKKQLLSMIYTQCEHTCPAIVSTMKMIANKQHNDIAYVLVSLTPETDTEAVLKSFAEKHDLDLSQWKLLRGNAQSIRELAMVLGIKYQLINDEQVNHSNTISILDEQGRLVFQAPGFPSEVDKISEKLKTHHHSMK